MIARLWLGLGLVLWVLPAAAASDYRPADDGQRPALRGAVVLPEQFLRGYDPITAHFPENRGPGRGPADDGARLLSIEPAWPGAWNWLDRKTLQFRPAEPWPALARFAVKLGGKGKVLTTMMSPPLAVSPPDGSDELRPFRTLSLTFPQVLPLEALRKMIGLEIRDAPGLADSVRRPLPEFSLALLPRADARDPAVYAITLPEEVPEGKRLHLRLALALGDEERALWRAQLATRPPFHLAAVQCGASALPLRGSAAVPAENALACGHGGETPVLVFSAPPADPGLGLVRRLVRLDPAVPELGYEVSGRRLVLRGRFAPDVLYRLSLRAVPLRDDSGRSLADPGEVEAFFYLGWRQPFLRWKQGQAILEANGPRMLPLIGYGEPRADVRIHRIDPRHPGLWPFPSNPVSVAEQAPPPFPGEEPERSTDDVDTPATPELIQHLRLLGAPLVSRVVDLPLAERSGTTHFGLDIGRLLDGVLDARRAGHYLVGLRRLTGDSQRSWMRVQVTNLSLTTVEQRDRVVFYVRTLDKAEPVSGARIELEVVREPERPKPGERPKPPWIDRLVLSTDGAGRAELAPQKPWREVRRLIVERGDDVLVIDPSDPPPRFANNHWSPYGSWLQWLAETIPPPADDRLVGFVLTERPIYRPGEKVYIKGWLRREVSGTWRAPDAAQAYALRIEGPGDKQWLRPVAFSPLYGFETEFAEKEAPTGRYRAVLLERKSNTALAARDFRIEAYRIPTFEVQLSAPERVPNDRPFTVKALGRYYAGGSVAGANIEWTVTRRPIVHQPRDLPGYLFASSLQFSREVQTRPGDTIHEQAALDDEGAHELTINPALDLDGSARAYRVEAAVTGADNQVVAAVQEVRALPPFVLGMQLVRYLEKPGPLSLHLVAVGVDDKPVAGQSIGVRLYRRTWHSHLRETDFSTGQAAYVTEQQDEKLLEREVHSAAAPVPLELPLDAAGVYVVELVARDRLGRVQTLSADLFVGGREPLAWEKPSQGVFELKPDQKKYRPGERARLVLQSPFQQGWALAVIEDPEGVRHEWLPVRAGQAVLSVPIAERHVPNLPVHVLLMRGRLGEEGSDDERLRPQTLAASTELEVEPVSHQAKVELDFPDTARPGSTVTIEVRLKDPAGKPLPGEVTLWLVDEAVLSLAEEAPLDPLRSLVRPNSRSVGLRDTRNRVIGRLAEQEEPAGDGAEGDESERMQGRRRVRKNFQTVPYYQATLVVGKSGVLRVPVRLSDDLTNFQVRAVAACGLARFGLRTSRLKVRLPVLVQPQLPRLVRQGDRFWAGGLGRLVEGPEGAGRVTVKVSGPVQARALDQAIELKRGQAQSLLVPVVALGADASAPAEVTVRMEIERRSDRAGDAFEVKLPLLPDREPERVASFERLRPGSPTARALPEPARAGTVRQRLTLSNVPGALELLAGLDYLAGYPHGCLEQRLSQLVSQILVGEALRRLGVNEHYALQVGEQVKRLLGELDLYQGDTGFFAFWPGGAADVALTAQAVEFLSVARRAGHTIPERAWSRALEALRSVLRSDSPLLLSDVRFNQQTEALRALTAVGELDEHYAIDMFHHVGELDLTSAADLALSMQARPALFAANLPELRERLWHALVFKLVRGREVFERLRDRRSAWGSGYLGSTTSTLAAVFEALVRLDPKAARLPLVRDALISLATAGEGFGSTHANRRAIVGLLAYLESAALAGPPATVELDGRTRLRLDDTTKVAQAVSSADEPMRLKVLEGEVAARLFTSYLPAEAGDRVAPRGAGFIVDRSERVLHGDDTPDSLVAETPGARWAVHLGEVVEVEVRLVNDAERYHVALVVPFAAGLELLNPELKNAPAEAQPSRADTTAAAYVQRLDGEVRYYFVRLAKGEHRFFFRLRPTVEGSFVHPAPWVEQMYHQEYRARGAGLRLQVLGDHEK